MLTTPAELLDELLDEARADLETSTLRLRNHLAKMGKRAALALVEMGEGIAPNTDTAASDASRLSYLEAQRAERAARVSTLENLERRGLLARSEEG